MLKKSFYHMIVLFSGPYRVLEGLRNMLYICELLSFISVLRPLIPKLHQVWLVSLITTEHEEHWWAWGELISLRSTAGPEDHHWAWGALLGPRRTAGPEEHCWIQGTSLGLGALLNLKSIALPDFSIEQRGPQSWARNNPRSLVTALRDLSLPSFIEVFFIPRKWKKKDVQRQLF